MKMAVNKVDPIFFFFYFSFLFLQQLIWGPRQEESEVGEMNTDEDSAERTGAGGDR